MNFSATNLSFQSNVLLPKIIRICGKILSSELTIPQPNAIMQLGFLKAEQGGSCLKLYNIDVQKLSELLDKAKGNVYLITDDGNKLNLKSKLCQMYGIHTLLEKAKDAPITAEISVENPEDELMFINYTMQK